jgi:hypothetical protein
MAIQLAVSTRNARLDAIETDLGTSAVLELRSGGQPANCAAGDTGTLLASLTLPVDWMSAASNGTKSKLGTWQDLSADNPGTIAHFGSRPAGAACKMQGSIMATSGGGDLQVDNTNVAAGEETRRAFRVSSNA